MQITRPQAAAPVLQIPTDQSRWQLMQKGLIAGGVYHVMMPDGGRQYCLWNGKQLVPCKFAVCCILSDISCPIRKTILSSFLRRRMVGGGRPLLPEILGQPARVGEKLPIWNQ